MFNFGQLIKFFHKYNIQYKEYFKNANKSLNGRAIIKNAKIINKNGKKETIYERITNIRETWSNLSPQKKSLIYVYILGGAINVCYNTYNNGKIMLLEFRKHPISAKYIDQLLSSEYRNIFSNHIVYTSNKIHSLYDAVYSFVWPDSTNSYSSWGYSPWGYSQWGYSPWGYSSWGYSPRGYSPRGYSSWGYSYDRNDPCNYGRCRKSPYVDYDKENQARQNNSKYDANQKNSEPIQPLITTEWEAICTSCKIHNFDNILHYLIWPIEIWSIITPIFVLMFNTNTNNNNNNVNSNTNV